MKYKIGGQVFPDVAKYLKALREGEEELLLPTDFEFVGPERFHHELVAFMFGLLLERCGLFMDMGTGKTCSAIDIAAYRTQRGDVEQSLVLCPTTVLYNWEREVGKFSNLNAEVLYGPLSDRIDRLMSSDKEFLITNYEIVRKLFPYIIDKAPGMVILDESTRVKNPQAAVTKAVSSICRGMPYKLLLSGQPIANNPIDIFSQYHIMDGGETFGTNFYRFRNYFFNRRRFGRFSTWNIKRGALPQITARMYKRAVRYLLEECVSMPGKTYQTYEIEMSQRQREIYKKLGRQIITEIKKEWKEQEKKDSFIRAEIAITKMTKLAQVCSGFLYDKGKTIRLKDNPKLSELRKIIKPLIIDRKVVVWCKFTETINLVSRMLTKENIGHVIYSGKQSPLGKKASEDALQNDPNVRVLVGQIRSGIGTTFTAANYAFYIENEWANEARVQSEERIYRIGQNEKVVIGDLVMKNSIEEKIFKAVRDKVKIASLIMKDPLDEFVLGGDK